MVVFMQSKKLPFAISEYQKQGELQNLRPATMKRRRFMFKRLASFLQNKPFNLKSAKAYTRDLKNKGWQISSVNTETQSLKAFVNFLFRRKYISENFAPDLLVVKNPRKVFNLISPEIVEKIIFAGCLPKKSENKLARRIKGNMLVALRFMLRTGLRVGELCSLKSNDFRLEDNPPNFTVTSKGGNKDILPLPRDMIEDLKLKMKKEKLFEITPKGLNRALQRGARNLKIKTRVHCHLLRHIFCTSLLREGVPIAKVKRLMRHSTLKYTDGIYSHYNLEDLDIALNSFPIIRVGLQSEEVFNFIERGVREKIKSDKRFELSINRNEKRVLIKVQLKPSLIPV